MLSLWLPVVLILVAVCGCGGGASLPPEALLHNQVGALALEQGDLELAGARFNLALEYNPEFIEAVTNLGSVELQRGNFARARQLLLRARRLNPDFAQAHHGLGVLAEREHKPDEASEHYRDALKVDPGFPESRANLARLLFEAGYFDHALVQFRRLREVVPSSIHAQSGYVASLLSLQRVAEAEAALEQLNEGLSEARPLRLLRARVHLAANELPSAERILNELAEAKDETGTLALAWLSVLELSQGRERSAVGAARQALALEPNQPVAVYVLAVALRSLGDPAADEWLNRALELNPKNPVLLRLKNRAPPEPEYG